MYCECLLTSSCQNTVSNTQFPSLSLQASHDSASGLIPAMFRSTNCSNLPMELPSEVTRSRQFHMGCRSFSEDEPDAPASPERPFDDIEGDRILNPFCTSSYVAWTTDHSPPNVTGAPAIFHSASSPIVSPRHRADAYWEAQPYLSTHNIHSDPASSDAADVPPYLNVKPLSAIAEQDDFLPERQSTVTALPPNISTFLMPTGSQYSGVTRE
jgi:hypothetical protein